MGTVRNTTSIMMNTADPNCADDFNAAGRLRARQQPWYACCVVIVCKVCGASGTAVQDAHETRSHTSVECLSERASIYIQHAQCSRRVVAGQQ